MPEPDLRELSARLRPAASATCARRRAALEAAYVGALGERRVVVKVVPPGMVVVGT